MASKSNEPHGRVVLNHSTHIPGLIAVLHKLSVHPQVKTLTPAVISRGRSHAPKLRLKISVPIRGGFKLIARKGKSIQEVFVITELSAEQLTALVEAVM